MLDEPRIVHTECRPAAVVRFTVPRSGIREAMESAFRDLAEVLDTQHIVASGPMFAHHFRLDPDVFDFEVGVPVASAFTPVGSVQRGELPEATVARTVYHGDFDGLGDAWGEFDEWVEEHGYTPAGELWETYVSGPESSADPADWATELNRPLASAPVR